MLSMGNPIIVGRGWFWNSCFGLSTSGYVDFNTSDDLEFEFGAEDIHRIYPKKEKLLISIAISDKYVKDPPDMIKQEKGFYYPADLFIVGPDRWQSSFALGEALRDSRFHQKVWPRSLVEIINKHKDLTRQLKVEIADYMKSEYVEEPSWMHSLYFKSILDFK